MQNRNEELAEFINREFKLLKVHYPLSIHEDIVVCSCHLGVNCTEKNKGKHPAESKGVSAAHARAGFDVFKDHARGSQYNIGVACGHGFAVLDIDPRNGGDKTLAALEKKHGKLPKTWTAATGGGGTHFYFSVEGEQAIGNKLKDSGVELKGVGSYVLAPTSLHASGKYYEWDVSPDECEMAPLPSWIVAECWEPAKEGACANEECGLGKYSAEEFCDALNHLSPDCGDKDWANVAMAMAAAGLDFEMFHAWSAKGEKYVNRDDCIKKWNSQVKAVKTKGALITVGTIIRNAREAGWEPKEMERWEIVSGEEEKAPVACVEDAQEPELSQRPFPGFPDGLIGDLAKEIYRVANEKDSGFAVASAIATVSAFAQGSYVSPIKRGYLNFYTTFVAPPSWGKEMYSSFPEKVLRRLNYSHLRMREPQSAGGLRRSLLRCNSQILTRDEVLLWLRPIIESDMRFEMSQQSDLLTLWGSSSNELAGQENKDESLSMPSVEAPRFSIIGGGTDSVFDGMLSKKGVELAHNGLMSRIDFIFPESDKFGETDPTDDDFELTDKQCEILQRIAGSPRIEEKASSTKSKKQVDTSAKQIRTIYDNHINVLWESSKDREAWMKIRRELNQYSDPLIRSLWNRTAEKTLRTACLMAIAEHTGRPEVGVRHIDWAYAWHSWVTERTVKRLLGAAYLTHEGLMRQLLLAGIQGLINVKSDVKLRDVKLTNNQLRKADQNTIDKALTTLCDEGMISIKGGLRRGSVVITRLV